jgi:hypothetical protein
MTKLLSLVGDLAAVAHPDSDDLWMIALNNRVDDYRASPSRALYMDLLIDMTSSSLMTLRGEGRD